MRGDTLVGRKVPMTSEVFWVSCGPPGGGGGTTMGPAIVSAFTQWWKSRGFYRKYMPPRVEIDQVLSLHKVDSRRLSDIISSRNQLIS